MAERIELPTPAQIEAMTDLPSLRQLRDDVDQVVTHIETRIQHSVDDGTDWRTRALGALTKHRHVSKLLWARIKTLQRRQAAGAVKAAPMARAAADNSQLTNEVLANRPDIGVDAIQTVEAIDATLSWLGERIVAVENDRNDEIAVPSPERDEGFMAATNTLLKSMRAQRSALQIRRGQISREARRAIAAERDSRRERMFVDAAREILPKATFEAIWARVDRQMAEAA